MANIYACYYYIILLKYWVKGEQFEDSGSEFNLDM